MSEYRITRRAGFLLLSLVTLGLLLEYILPREISIPITVLVGTALLIRYKTLPPIKDKWLAMGFLMCFLTSILLLP